MRNTLILAAVLALTGCGANSGAPSTTTTTGTGTTISLAPLLQLGAGTLFTVVQAAALAEIKSHPTTAAGIQTALSAAQAAFVSWVNAPAGTSGQQIALQALTAANTSLLTSLTAKGVKF